MITDICQSDRLFKVERQESAARVGGIRIGAGAGTIRNEEQKVIVRKWVTTRALKRQRVGHLVEQVGNLVRFGLVYKYNNNAYYPE